MHHTFVCKYMHHSCNVRTLEHRFELPFFAVEVGRGVVQISHYYEGFADEQIAL